MGKIAAYHCRLTGFSVYGCILGLLKQETFLFFFFFFGTGSYSVAKCQDEHLLSSLDYPGRESKALCGTEVYVSVSGFRYN